MEAATERRDPHATRVPLDDVLVDLYPEGHDESFPADAIDVGLGGLAMRSAVLPDVGARLRCRFRSPEDGSAVAADAEVVWAADSGPNHGQFGLRFTELEASDAERIAELVDAWHASLGALSIANDTDDEPSGQRMSLRIDGVGPAVDTELMHADGQAMIVEQPLPFLTIGKGIEAQGRRGVLEAVDLRMEGATPRLTLTVLFEQHRGESTLAEESAPVTTTATEAAPATLDETEEPTPAPQAIVPREIDARGPASVATVDALAEDDFDDEDAIAEADADALASKGGVVEAAPAHVDEDVAADAEALAADDEEEDAPEAEVRSDDDDVEARAEARAKAADPLLSELRADPRATLRKVLGRVLPLWVRVRAWTVVVWAKLGPWAKIAGSRIRSLFVRSWTTLRKLRGESAQKRTQRRPQQRQRQTRAPRRQARPGERARGAETKEPARPARRIVRVVALAAVFGLGVLLTRFAFASDPAPTLSKPEMAPVAAELPAEPTMDPEAGDDPSAGAAAQAVESAEAAAEGGPLDAPSFPSMPSAAAAGQPLAFGADRVAGGREFRLRLSVPPTALRGEPTDNGFQVVLDGSNAIDGARRIAATHPRVAHATIYNRGERAELNISFAAGADPDYRVEARGDALLVTIGR